MSCLCCCLVILVLFLSLYVSCFVTFNKLNLHLHLLPLPICDRKIDLTMDAADFFSGQQELLASNITLPSCSPEDISNRIGLSESLTF
ncbi:hypothetical protein PGIGA_G00012220 [Pangasianodon gigas]|uniref:Uncharacterized protein n=1 Tax=Pangasianodon gigas TaxID=30993 RepID=A0ACC5W8C5_PANGG|nr:hypothetical protein [Pangasianodon gigas]